jgi:hypothetical protein
MASATPNATHTLSAREFTIWRSLQVLIWAMGMLIWGALIFKPSLGLHLLWNVLIPVAPALMVLAPGVWRNVCPLGSMSLAPHHFGLSQRRQLVPVWRGRLYLGAFILLMAVVPMRKVLLDTNGPVLATILCVVGLLAIGMGVIFDQKSGWCSSLCPVYPVELLYGSQPRVTVPNAHCPPCVQCVSPCSESTAGLTPRTAIPTKLGKGVGIVLTGCFPGFVWGWYNVETYSGWDGFAHLHQTYGIPYTAGGLTLLVYFALRKVWPRQEKLISSIFAATAISVYYWYRLPPVFGIGNADLAMIVDISDRLPAWTTAALRTFVLLSFGWLMIARPGKRRAWETHPLPVKSPSNKKAVENPMQSARDQKRLAFFLKWRGPKTFGDWSC